MSRSGYSDDLDPWALICWRGAVASAIKGHRGQALLREMAAALDAMPVKRLAASELRTEEGEVCALGAVACARSIDVTDLDPYDQHAIAERFGIARALAAEIAFENDDGGWRHDTPEQRWERMRGWVAQQIRGAAAPSIGHDEPNPKASP